MAVPLRLVRVGLGATLVVAAVGTVLAPPPVTAQSGALPPATRTASTAESDVRVDTVSPPLNPTSGAESGGRLTGGESGVATFTTIGASYSSAGGEGRVQVHTAEGWSRWYELHGATGGDHGPDPGSVEASGTRPASDPVWVGEADGYRLSLPADAAGVQVHLVRPTGARVAVEAGSVGAEGVESAPGAVPPVRLRAAWGARPYRGTIELNRRIVRGVVHHTETSNDYTAAEVPSILRAIQRYHQDTRGWNDIAYNFVVDRFGTIWEARARSYRSAVVGAASSGTNLQTVAVSFLGSATVEAPPSATLRSLGRLLGWKMRKHGLRPTRANIMGHRDVGSTNCPGDALYAQLAAVENVARNGNPPPGPYFDVAWTRPDARAIDWAGQSGVIPGFPDGTFQPRGEATRAAAYVWLWRTAGARTAPNHPYTDVARNAPYVEAVDWASRQGIATPASGRFRPGRPITRLRFVELLWRYAGSPEVATTHSFTDSGPSPALDWAVAFGLVGGPSFRPDAVLRRAAAAVLLERIRPFADVGPLHVARRAVDWAWFHQVVNGRRNHTFGPGAVVRRSAAAAWVWHLLDKPAPGPVDAAPGADRLTRDVAAVWLWEAAGSPTVTLPSGYTDLAGGEPYEMAAAWVERHALFMEGDRSTFRAPAPMTRSELVRALYRLAGRPSAWAVPLPTAAW